MERSVRSLYGQPEEAELLKVVMGSHIVISASCYRYMRGRIKYLTGEEPRQRRNSRKNHKELIRRLTDPTEEEQLLSKKLIAWLTNK